MKFIVEIENLYIEEGDLENELKSQIISEITHEIWDMVKKECKDELIKQIHEMIHTEITTKANEFITQILQNEKLPVRYEERKYTLKELIIEQFKNNSSYGNPNNVIKELAREFGEELKQRYDMLFASQIVNALNKNHLLKDEVADLLLDKENK